jgi:hypothetical protein
MRSALREMLRLSAPRPLAPFRHAAMSAIAPLSGVKRKWLGHRQTDAIDPNRKSSLPMNCRRRIEFATRMGRGGGLIKVM